MEMELEQVLLEALDPQVWKQRREILPEVRRLQGGNSEIFNDAVLNKLNSLIKRGWVVVRDSESPLFHEFRLTKEGAHIKGDYEAYHLESRVNKAERVYLWGSVCFAFSILALGIHAGMPVRGTLLAISVFVFALVLGGLLSAYAQLIMATILRATKAPIKNK